LAITSTTRMISIDAFPFQHSSLSPTISSPKTSTTPTLTIAPWMRRNQMNQPCFAFQNINPQRHRLLHGTFLAAEPKSGENINDGGATKSSTTAALIDATIDAGSIAAMDPDYQKYKESLSDPNLRMPSLVTAEQQNESTTNGTSMNGSDSSVVAEKKGDIKIATPDPTEEKEEQKEQLQQKRANPADTLQGFNVVLTHCTADFDSLASAVGLAKLWSFNRPPDDEGDNEEDDDYDNSTDGYPTFVVLPRGAHPAVQRFLALHKHLFPIRSLKSLPNDLSKLHRLALVDAQRKDRIGPAESLLQYADRITVVDHHVDMESDIPGITDYVVDGVGSVSTLIVERLMRQQEKQLMRQLESSSSPIPTLTEAEATLLALGIHADTGSLCFDSTTPRDASALAWVMHQGASQVAIAEHAQSSLSREQQTVLTQALVNANATVAHGVTVTTVLLTADGFINGLAAVTQDAMELSSADVFLLGVVYEPKSGRGGKSKKPRGPGKHVKSKLLQSGARISKPKQTQAEADAKAKTAKSFPNRTLSPSALYKSELTLAGEEKRLDQERLRSSFDEKDLDGNGYIDRKEMSKALVASGIIATEGTVLNFMQSIDTNLDGLVDFDEFVAFASNVKSSLVVNDNNDNQQKDSQDRSLPSPKDTTASKSSSSSDSGEGNPNSPSSTLIIIGRARPGVNLKSVNLGKLLEKYGGGGHPKAASATVRLEHESQASTIMSGLVDELIETSLQEQSTVGDFMTSPVLSVKSDMSENHVEDLFNRYDVRALPVVNEDNEVIGLVTYKEVAAAKERMWNKEQKRLRQELQRKEQEQKEGGSNDTKQEQAKQQQQRSNNNSNNKNNNKSGPTVKAWMKQHIKTVEASTTMAEVEAVLLENDVGCIPVVQDGTMRLVGMVTRTDLLRQHRYYPSLHYNNKGMSDSLASRKHIVALRKKLKQFDLDE
jgi:nanoRNase/pAp phosphatase (c-di-AMP/oligoRNAs hydrolase)